METEERKTTMGETEAEMSRLEEQAKKKVQSLKEEAVDRGRKYLELQKGTTAAYMKDFAEAMETAASHLDSMQRRVTSEYIKSASRELKRWSSSLRDYGIDSLAQQAQAFAGRHPGMVLGGAAVAGFAVTRVFRSVERLRKPAEGGKASRMEESAPAEQVYRPSEYRQTPAEEFGPHS